jgi:hypothetical protein
MYNFKHTFDHIILVNCILMFNLFLYPLLTLIITPNIIKIFGLNRYILKYFIWHYWNLLQVFLKIIILVYFI